MSQNFNVPLWPCLFCGQYSHNGLKGSEAWEIMAKAGCVCEHCTSEPCGRDDCPFAEYDGAEPDQ